MSSNLEKELSEILAKIHFILKEKGITLQASHDLYFTAKEKYLAAKEEERTEEARIYSLDIFFQVGGIVEKFVKDWQEGKFKPTITELNLLKEGCEEVLVAFDNHFKWNLLAHYGWQFDENHTKVKQKVQYIKGLIQEEENKKDLQ